MAAAARPPLTKLGAPVSSRAGLSPVRDGPQTRPGSRRFRRTPPLPRLPAAAGERNRADIFQQARKGRTTRIEWRYLPHVASDIRFGGRAPPVKHYLGLQLSFVQFEAFLSRRAAGPAGQPRSTAMPFGRKGARGPDAGPVVNGAGGRARTGTLREKRILSPLRLPVSPRPQGVQRWRSAAFGGVLRTPRR